MRHPFLCSRIFNVPLALHPAKASVVVAVLADRLGIEADAGAFETDAFAEPATSALAGYDTVAGVAVIPVEGVLVHKTGFVRPVSGLTGYDSIRAALLGALDDPAIRAIVLDVNSPGGEVDGLFDLVDAIYEARSVKPIRAVVSGAAYSAAYALASAAHRITVPRTGGVGSIGVIAMLTDVSRALKGAGVQVHFVHHGAQKAREMRESYQGVSPELLARLQADIDRMGELFVGTVARNRGLPFEAVRGQEADYYLGQDGVDAGLADRVQAPDDAFVALLADLDAA